MMHGRRNGSARYATTMESLARANAHRSCATYAYAWAQ